MAVNHPCVYVVKGGGVVMATRGTQGEVCLWWLQERTRNMDQAKNRNHDLEE